MAVFNPSTTGISPNKRGNPDKIFSVSDSRTKLFMAKWMDEMIYFGLVQYSI